MSNQIILKKSSVEGKAPLAGDLQPGEIAINLTDKLLYSKDTGDNVFNIKADPRYDTGLQDALDAKTNNTVFADHTANTSNPHVVTATQVGLGNVTNESKETMFASPSFTGTPLAPTPNYTDNSTQIATTEFVQNLVAGGGSEIQAVASGNLSNGDKVVVNADGTVSVVSESEVPTSVGSEATFNSGITYNISCTYDSANGKVVIVHQGGTAVVGTVSGNSISFGSPVDFNIGRAWSPSCAYDSANGKVVIAYSDGSNSYYGTAIVGTVSGTSISFGSEVVFNSASTNSIFSTYDSANGKVVIAYRDDGNSQFGTAVVGTVSGTSISFGSEYVFNGGFTTSISSTYDSANGKVVIAYSDWGNSQFGTAVVGTVSGTSISFGSEVVFNSGITTYISSTYDSANGKVVIAYSDGSNSNYGTAVVGTVSGTSISFGSEVVFNSGYSSYTSSTYDSTNGKVVIAYRDYDNSNYGTAVVGTVSGTSISFGSEVVFNSGYSSYTSSTYDSTNGKVVIAYRDYDNSSHGIAVVFEVEHIAINLTSDNYIGISDDNYNNGETATIQVIGGVNDAQTGLTAGYKYYVQADNTLSTTPDDPSVVAGIALSSTKLLIK